ncbi:MAG: hypothetical protein JOY99_00930 [Sphingomonadaceae bacterium]|nr:hypothetical protein [Sphingomonadaceae bacterium]
MRNAYVSAEDALTLPGLRIAFTRGYPGPWSEAVKAIFEIKRIDYVPVVQEAGGANETLYRWTGQRSAPVAMFEDERPRALWSEMIMLAERLAPDPPMLPADQDERAAMFGLCHEICGEDGLGWNARALAFAAAEGDARSPAGPLRARFADGADVDHARIRVNAVIGMLARRLTAQRDVGRRYFIGTRLSAADIYWTTFSNFFASMPASICPMPDAYRAMAEVCAAALDRPLPPILVVHRDDILERYFTLPMSF